MSSISADSTSNRSGILFATVTVLAWGMTGVFVRMLSGFPPLFITGMRLLIALIAVLPVVLFSRGERFSFTHALRQRAVWSLSTLLITYYVLAVVAFQYGGVAEVSLFVGMSPLWALFGKIVKRVRIERHEKIGAALAIAGIIVVTSPSISFHSGVSSTRLLGDGLGLLAAGASALYAGQYRQMRECEGECPDVTIVATLAFILGSVLLIGVSVIVSPIVWSHVTATHALLIFLGLGVLSTAIPSISYALASQRLPPVIATTTQLFIPVVAAVAAAFILREMPSVWLVPGGLLVLGGVAYMLRGHAASMEDTGYSVPD